MALTCAERRADSEVPRDGEGEVVRGLKAQIWDSWWRERSEKTMVKFLG